MLVTDLNEDEAKKLLATYDPLGALAKPDLSALQEIRDGVGFDEPDLAAMVDDLIYSLDTAAQAAAEIEAWQGMPECQQNQMVHRQLVVSFLSVADFNAFEKLIGQQMTDKTRAIWYPKAEWAGPASWDDAES